MLLKVLRSEHSSVDGLIFLGIKAVKILLLVSCHLCEESRSMHWEDHVHASSFVSKVPVHYRSEQAIIAFKLLDSLSSQCLSVFPGQVSKLLIL